MSEYIIDTETITTDAGDYTVEFVVDESAQEPEDDGFVLFLAGDRRRDGITYGDVDSEAASVIRTHANHEDHWEHELRSGKALVRYLTLKGYKGVTLVTQSLRADEPTADRFDHVQGVAYAPDDATDPDAYVKGDLESWRAWAEGDTFGYRVLDPQGDEVDSCWGYYGWAREYDYVLSEATDAAKYDATERVARANLSGAGFVGVL